MASLTEAKIRPSRRSVGILNSVIATVKEAPLPIKLLTIGVGTVTTASILYGCDTKSPPCEILPTDTPDQKGGVCPLTIYAYHPEKVLSPEDQAAYAQKYGSNVNTIYQWYAVNKGSNSESVGDGLVAFTTYYFDNGKSVVVFPSADDDYFSEKAEKHEFKTSFLETSDGKILKSYNYSGNDSDELGPENPMSFVTIEYNKPDGATLEDIATNPSLLGDPTSLIISNPPAHEEISYNLDPKNPDDERLLDAIASLTGAGVVHALGQGTATSEAPTAIPTPIPVEVAPGEFIPASQIVGYEAHDVNGKLIYTQDLNGKWIKVNHEVTVSTATSEDWTNVNTRLGSDFVISTDGLITGVEGLNIDKANGEATFNFDGKGTEVYHVGNIKVQEVNGEKRLLVAGYMWNGETKSWEVFNPGFPMESPEAQLGWFMEADVSNGNWLRWHQRAIEGVDMEALFPVDSRPDSWGIVELGPVVDRRGGGIFHVDILGWENNKIDPVDRGRNGIKKTQYPGREALSFGYLTDLKMAIVSFDALNGDGSATSFPMIIDEVLWTKHRNDQIFTSAALASGHEWDSSMTKVTFFGDVFNNIESWQIWPNISVYPDATALIFAFSQGEGQSEVEILKRPEGIARRKATIQGDKIAPAASLEIWDGGISLIPHN